MIRTYNIGFLEADYIRNSYEAESCNKSIWTFASDKSTIEPE